MRAIFHTIVWLLELAVGLAFIALVLIAIIPWLLSINGTRTILLSLAGTATDRHIAMEEADFSWFGPQYVKGLCIQDPARHASLRCDEIATEASLWQIVFGNHDIGDMRICSPYLLVQTDQSYPEVASAQLLHAGPHLSSISGFCAGDDFARRFTGQIEAQGGTIEIAGPYIDSVFFRSVAVDAKRKAGENLTFKVQGDTSQKSERGEILGNFHLEGTLAACADKEEALALTGVFTRLPVLGLDQMVALARPELRGMLVTALGSTMDLSVSAVLGKEKGELALELSSPQAKGSIAMATQDGSLALRAPATGSITMTRTLADALFSPVPGLRELNLASSSSHIQFNIDTLAIPLTEEGLQWQDLSAKGTMSLTNLKLQTPALTRTIDFNQLEAAIKTDRLQKELLVDAKVNLRYADTSCALASAMQIASPLKGPSVDTLTMSVDRFPVVFFDHLLLKNGQFADALGSTLDIRFGIEQNDNIPIATLYLSSPQVAIDGAVLAIKPHIQLIKPFNILLNPTAAWLQNCLPNVAVAPINIAVKDFSIGESLSTMAGHIEAASESFSIENYLLSHPLVTLNLKGWEDITLALQAEGLSGALNFSYDNKQNQVTSKEASRILATFEPAAWEAFSSHLGKATELLRPAAATLELQPFCVSLDQPFAKLALAGTLELADFAITQPSQPGSRFALQDVSFRWRLDKEKREFAARGEGKITGATDAWSTFQMESLVRNLPSGRNATPTPADIVCKCAAEALDTTALDPWFDITHSLSSLFGSPLNLKAEVTQKPASSSFIVNAKSNRLQLECGLSKSEDKLVLRNSRQPILVNWTVTPEGFDVGADLWKNMYQEELPLSLSKPCPISMRIDALSIPWQSGLSLTDAIAQAIISGRLSIERLPLVEKTTEEPLTFQHIELQIQRPGVKSPLQFNLQTAVEAAKPGLAEVKGTIAHNDLLRMNMEANFQNLPTTLPDVAATLAGLKPRTLATIFGPALTGSFKTNIEASSGPLSVQINTPSTRLSLNGYVNKGVLSLQEPLIAQVTMTEEFSRRLLEQTNPLSVDIVTSEGPMTLTVDKEGFSFPLFPYNLSAAIIPHARIDLGRITCHNQGNLTTMLTLLKQGQFTRQKDLKLWFAPLDISMKGGIVECERTEVLVADHFDIATWGQIDLNKNRVDAILGLTSQAIESAFGIKDLPPDYILQLPMKGKIGNVKIDTKKATAKIALLLAWQQTTSPSSGGILGGTKGAIVGGLLGQLSKLPDYGESAPPAKHPFPWENDAAQTTPSSKKKKKAAIKPGEKPVKQLLKLFR